ncbi:MAG: tRNA (guanine(10)-N(2))-dimethyltransferase [Candidatus Helarchaeota archaeon]
MTNSDSLKQELNFPIILHKEGSTSFYVPDLDYFKGVPSEYLPSKLPVFFNTIMEFRRDISILAIKTYQSRKQKQLTFCDPLAASGAMGIRVANELKDINVYINDINEKAVILAKKSIQYNKLKNIHVVNDYANDFMIEYSKKVKRFNIIDLDPFGTPVPYLDVALYAIRGDGLISCTATDMPPLVGIKHHLQSCIRNYGSIPLKTEYAHETALRILIGFIVRMAAKGDKAIRILFSHSSNHYIQIFAKIEHGILLANEVIKNIGYIGHCFECENRIVQKGLIPELIYDCEFCGKKRKFAGPLWLGKLCDIGFCQEMLNNLKDLDLNTKNRIKNLIEMIINESIGIISYHNIHRIGKKNHLNIPPISKIISELKNRNYTASRTHFNLNSIKTNAPREEITNIIKYLQ